MIDTLSTESGTGTAAARAGTPPEAFEELLAEIPEGELAREETRTLPWGPVERLRALGFGVLRVPRAYGGGEVRARRERVARGPDRDGHGRPALR